MTDMAELGERVARLHAGLDAAHEIAKGLFGGKGTSHWPAGSPGAKGGQFAPKGASGAGSAGTPAYHPHPNDKGERVKIHNPSMASHPDTWGSGNATFTPGSHTPDALHGTHLTSWGHAPTTKAGWQTVEGQNHTVEPNYPVEAPRGKSVGAGVVIREPDGRIWLTKPTNHYGGYVNTFPKGTVEDAVPSVQANAIKEAHEESGLKVKITGHIGDFERSTSVARFYAAERVGGTPKDMGWETQAMRLVHPDVARKMLNSQVDRDILDAAMAHWRSKGIIKASGRGGGVGQARWPKGTPLGGQWKASGSGGFTKPPKKMDKKTGQMVHGIGSPSNKNHTNLANSAYRAAQAGDLKTLHAIADKTSGAAHKYATADKKALTFHDKEGAKVHQYVSELIHESGSKGKVEATAAKITGPQKLSDLGPQTKAKPGGSNPGGVHGAWLVKGNLQKVAGKVDAQTSDDRAKNEVLAAKLINHVLPGHAPDMKLVDLEGKHGGGLGVASKMVDGVSGYDKSSAAHKAEVQKTFALHAWLGNYDAIGLSHDNMVMKDGKAINIDPGGAILFRAQGLKKSQGEGQNDWGPVAHTWDTMRNASINSVSAGVFGSMTHAELKASAETLTHISDADIHHLVDAHGPGTAAEKTKLAETLIARKADILQRAGVGTAPEEGGTLTQGVTHPGISKPVFATGYSSDKYYNDLAEGMAGHHATGDAAALHAMASGKNGAPAWPEKTINGKKMTAYHEALKADLAAKQAPVQEAKPKPAPKAPDSENAVPVHHPAKVKAAIDAAVSSFDGSAAKSNALADMKAGWQKEFLHAKDGSPMHELAAAALAHIEGHEDALARPLAAKPLPKAPKFNQKNIDAPGFSVKSLNKTVKTIGVYAGNKEKLETMKAQAEKWPDSPSVGKIKDYLHAMAEHAGSAAKPARAPKAPEPVQAVKPALPHFDSHKIDASNSNAPSHNKKVDQIAALAHAGDVEGLKGLKIGVNTYGKKQASLVNDVLAALGSNAKAAPATAPKPAATKQAGAPSGDHSWLKLGKGETVIEHGEKFGVKFATVAVPAKGYDPSKIPSPPDFYKNGQQGPTGTWKSSKPEVNDANNAAVQKIYETATKNGTPEAVNGLKFNVVGHGEVPIGDHKAAEVKEYHKNVLSELHDQLTTTQKTYHSGDFHASYDAAAKELAASIPAKAHSEFKAHADKAADYLVLSKDAGAAVPKPEPGVFKDRSSSEKVMQDFKKASAAAYANLSKTEQTALHGYTGSKYIPWNQAMRTGDVNSSAFKEAAPMRSAFEKVATEIPAGTILHRGLSVGQSTYEKVLGAVIQDGSFQSASFGTQAAFSGKQSQLRIHVGAGVKGIDATTFSALGSAEREIIMAPNTRYVVMAVHPGKHGGHAIIDVLALPHT